MQRHVRRYKRGERSYYAGIAAAVLFTAAAELIWLPAPLETEDGMQWIEWIDYLYYALSIVPALWAAGAFLRTYKAEGVPVWLLAIRGLGAAAALSAAVSVWLFKQSLAVPLGLMAAAALLLLADLTASEIAAGRPGLRLPRRSLTVAAVTAALLLALAYPTGYRVTYPAMTMNMNRYAHVSGGSAHGIVDGVLVFERPAVLADWLYARLLPMYRFEPVSDDEPPLSVAYSQVTAMKRDANEVAAAIAMEKAGIGHGVVEQGVKIVAIVKDGPADGTLRAGDVITGLDGREIRSAADMIAYMTERVKPGQEVTVRLVRDEAELETSVATAPSEQDPARAVFGVSVQTDVSLDVPRDIQFDTYIAHIGGPSHGAMLTLALIDQLTPGGVTNELRVAGTGTIETDGSIGMVGGIPQKAYAVSRTAADVFFVPSAGEDAAKEAAPGLNVVPVGHIDDILAWLAER